MGPTMHSRPANAGARRALARLLAAAWPLLFTCFLWVAGSFWCCFSSLTNPLPLAVLAPLWSVPILTSVVAWKWERTGGFLLLAQGLFIVALPLVGLAAALAAPPVGGMLAVLVLVPTYLGLALVVAAAPLIAGVLLVRSPRAPQPNLVSPLNLALLILPALAFVLGILAVPAVQQVNARALAFRQESAAWSATAAAEAPNTRIILVRYSPDGRRILTVSYAGAVRVWDAETGARLFALSRCSVQALIFTADGKRIMSEGCLWDAESGRELRRFKWPTYWNHAYLGPDGRQVVLAQGRFVSIWDADTGKQLVKQFEANNADLSDAAFSPDGRYLATAGGSHGVRLWDAMTGTPLLTLGSLDANRVAFSPDGKHLATDGPDRMIHILDAATGRELRSMEEKQTDYVRDVSYSPDGKLIVSLSDSHVYLLDAETGKRVTRWDSGSGVWAAEFSPDGRRIVTAQDSGSALVWDAATGRRLLALQVR